jgi:hypothetical protein
MKIIFQWILAAGLLASAGCVLWDGHNRADVREHRPPAMSDEHSGGVDHGEHPGDVDHDVNR